MGDNADNYTIKAHRMSGTGGFDLVANRHHGALNIDATSSSPTKSQWHDVVDALGASDATFDSACATAFGGWYATHVTGIGRRDEFRGLIADLVT